MPEPINLPEANGPPNARQPELEAELGRLRELVRTLTAERDQLSDQLRRVRSEADNYRNALYTLTRKECSMSEDERAAIEADGLTLNEIIEELERSYKR